MGGRAFFAIDLAINFLLPWLFYRVSKPHVGETHAIMISAGAPMVWGLVQFARRRKIDAFSVISLAGIALSFAIFAIGGSPKVLLVRESFFVGAIGLVFLISAAVGRPLMFELVRAMVGSIPDSEGGMSAPMRREFEAYGETPWFRQLMGTMTVAFGFIGIAEMAARVALAYLLPTERFFLVAPIVRYAIAGIGILWIFLYVMPAVRREVERS